MQLSQGHKLLSIAKTDSIEIFPLIFFAFWIGSQIVVFWFALFRIVPITHAILFALIYLIHFTNKVTIPPSLKLIGLYVAIYLLIIVSCYWAPEPPDSFDAALETLAAAMPAFFAGEYLARRYNLRSIFIGVHLIPVLVFPQFIYNYLIFDDFVIFDIYSMRTIIGTILAGVSPIVFGYYFVTKNKLSLLLAILCAVLVVVMQSRASIISVSISYLVIWMFFSPRIALFWTIIIAPFLLFSTVIVQSDYFERFSGESTNIDVSSNVLSELSVDRELRVDFDRRLHTFITFEMIQADPIFGAGYRAVYQNNKFEFGIDLPAHGYIGSFAEIGLASGLILLLLWRQIFLRCRQYLGFTIRSIHDSPLDYILILGFISVLFTGLFHQAFESPNFAFFTGLVIGRLAQLDFLQRTVQPVTQMRNPLLHAKLRSY